MYAHWKVWLLMLGWHLLLYNRVKYDRNVSVTPTPTHHQSLSRLETEVCVVNLEYIKRNSLNSRYVDSELCSVKAALLFSMITSTCVTQDTKVGTRDHVSEPCVQLIKTSYGTQICPNIFPAELFK